MQRRRCSVFSDDTVQFQTAQVSNESAIFSEEVLWFERIASPMREAMREHYIRQPIIFRWVCDSTWIKQKLQELGLRMIIVSKVDEMIK